MVYIWYNEYTYNNITVPKYNRMLNLCHQCSDMVAITNSTNKRDISEKCEKRDILIFGNLEDIFGRFGAGK